jgi:hypothetical protein
MRHPPGRRLRRVDVVIERVQLRDEQGVLALARRQALIVSTPSVSLNAARASTLALRATLSAGGGFATRGHHPTVRAAVHAASGTGSAATGSATAASTSDGKAVQPDGRQRRQRRHRVSTALLWWPVGMLLAAVYSSTPTCCSSAPRKPTIE